MGNLTMIFDQCAVMASGAPYEAGNFVEHLAKSIEQNQLKKSFQNPDGNQSGLLYV